MGVPSFMETHIYIYKHMMNITMIMINITWQTNYGLWYNHRHIYICIYYLSAKTKNHDEHNLANQLWILVGKT